MNKKSLKIVSILLTIAATALVILKFSHQIFASDDSLDLKTVTLSGKLKQNGYIQFDRNDLKKLPYKPQQKIIIGKESDIVQIKIFDEPKDYIYQAKVSIDLKAVQSNVEDVTLRTYAIHGIEATNQEIINSQANFESYNILQSAVWTIELNFPKQVLSPSLYERIIYWSAGHSLIWFAISFLLISAILMIILFLIWKRAVLEKIQSIDKVVTAPPSDLSSSALAILEHKHAAQRAVAAGILYLAARGYLAIVKTEKGFLVARHKAPTELSGLDKEFYQMLIGNWFAQSSQGIRLEVSRSLFNQPSGIIHQELYKELSERGLFVSDPWLTIHKTRIIGIIAFILSAIGFFISLAILPYPPFASAIWVAMMIASVLIQKIAIMMPLRSSQGVAEREKWHAFKKFLESPTPASAINLPMDIYLHYAVALNCEDKWILKFMNNNYLVPAWYIGPSVTMEDIAADIMRFVMEFSQIIKEGVPPEEI